MRSLPGVQAVVSTGHASGEYLQVVVPLHVPPLSAHDVTVVHVRQPANATAGMPAIIASASVGRPIFFKRFDNAVLLGCERDAGSIAKGSKKYVTAIVNLR
jgi:hypothetical protein